MRFMYRSVAVIALILAGLAVVAQAQGTNVTGDGLIRPIRRRHAN